MTTKISLSKYWIGFCTIVCTQLQSNVEFKPIYNSIVNSIILHLGHRFQYPHISSVHRPCCVWSYSAESFLSCYSKIFHFCPTTNIKLGLHCQVEITRFELNIDFTTQLLFAPVWHHGCCDNGNAFKIETNFILYDV